MLPYSGVVKAISISVLLASAISGLLLGRAGPSEAYAAQSVQNVPLPPPIMAVRTCQPITIDGRLDESVWKNAPAGGFRQNPPHDGKPATEWTHVWVAYDETALYVAALCHDTGQIVARLARRDDFTESDWFVFEVDPRNDGRSGFRFAITPAGSILDSALFNDINEDRNWDGVWESAARVDTEGWTVEMRIPFNQLRFPKNKTGEYVWGVDFHRQIMRKSEWDVYSWVPSSENAHVSRFAQLLGIKGITPGHLFDVKPYVVGTVGLQPVKPGDPFRKRLSGRWDAGGDLKIGLMGDLTLDATVNPDFGQVEVDPAVINLSAYEVYYDEKRDFFVEGASLFNNFGQGAQGGDRLPMYPTSPQPQFFYSRRIGRAPEPPTVHPGGFVDSPDRTRILGAAKITGRLGDWNVGFLNALTARENALTSDLGVRSKQEVGPFSWYGVLRAQKDVERGYRGFGVIVTRVERCLPAGSSLSDGLNKNAQSLGFDGWSFLGRDRDWVIDGWLGGTWIGGTKNDIAALQTSPLHYFQRPDATHVRLDPTATSLSGWGGGLNIIKQNGPLLFSLKLSALSPGFDPTDIGFQRPALDVLGNLKEASDNISFSGLLGKYWNSPWLIFQEGATIGIGPSMSFDFGGNAIGGGVMAVLAGPLRNFWDLRIRSRIMPRTLDDQLTRGGPLAANPAAQQFDFSLRTDSRRRVIVEGDVSFGHQSRNGRLWNIGLNVGAWLSHNCWISAGPTYQSLVNQTQWIQAVDDPLVTSTYGRRYVFGRLRERLVSAQARFNWALNPTWSLQGYVQPFIGRGNFDRFKELDMPKTFDFNFYGEGGSTVIKTGDGYTIDPDGNGPAPPFSFLDPDLRPRSLSGTVVLRWEYRPGSALYLVWTRNSPEFTGPGTSGFAEDLVALLKEQSVNTILLKGTYRWNW